MSSAYEQKKDTFCEIIGSMRISMETQVQIHSEEENYICIKAFPNKYKGTKLTVVSVTYL